MTSIARISDTKIQCLSLTATATSSVLMPHGKRMKERAFLAILEGNIMFGMNFLLTHITYDHIGPQLSLHMLSTIVNVYRRLCGT
ncbi:hypothetical protein PM082_018814 [Marasmius tenuissimus]|nr:hypothetical protein PM082_018814 [Marasmius tenuissimus]